MANSARQSPVRRKPRWWLRIAVAVVAGTYTCIAVTGAFTEFVAGGLALGILEVAVFIVGFVVSDRHKQRQSANAD